MTCRQARSPQLTGEASFSGRRTPAEFRAKADQCRALAAQCTFPFEKEAWLKLADDWLVLAREAEPIHGIPTLAYSAPERPLTHTEVAGRLLSDLRTARWLAWLCFNSASLLNQRHPGREFQPPSGTHDYLARSILVTIPAEIL